jgi:urease accessory protein
MSDTTMHMIRHHIPAQDAAASVEAIALPLPFDLRKRSRQRWTLPDGIELAWVLTPGTLLQPGDRLQAEDGTLFAIHAAAEHVLRITAATPLALTRAAYHLGNRHISVEVGDGYLAIEPDPVLREMLLQLGVTVTPMQLPFQPETGAYGGGHKHGHDATFAEDYALAQAVFHRHEPEPAIAPLGRHQASHDHEH